MHMRHNGSSIKFSLFYCMYAFFIFYNFIKKKKMLFYFILGERSLPAIEIAAIDWNRKKKYIKQDTCTNTFIAAFTESGSELSCIPI